MRIKKLAVIFILLVFFLQSCDILDVRGLIFSSSVSDRFRKSSSLWPVSPSSVADENEFSFLVITDTHYYRNDPQIFEEIEANRSAWGIEFIVVAGDITQSGRQEQYDIMLTDRNHFAGDVFCIPGNHDIYNSNADNYFKNLGAANYSMTIGDCLFVMLDTANGTLGQEQWGWYKEILEKSTAINIFVFSHYSLFDEGTQAAYSWPAIEEKYALLSLNTEHRVDYFLSGHMHRFRETILDNVKYIMLNDLKNDSKDTMLKISVSGRRLSHEIIK